MKTFARTTTMLVAVFTAACSPTPVDGPAELRRVRSGDLEVVLRSQNGHLSNGKDALLIEFRRNNRLVDVGDVKGFATMPMAGLPPMMGSVFLERGDVVGRYKAETDLSMAGGWHLTLEWDGPAGRGSANIDVVAE